MRPLERFNNYDSIVPLEFFTNMQGEDYPYGAIAEIYTYSHYYKKSISVNRYFAYSGESAQEELKLTVNGTFRN